MCPGSSARRRIMRTWASVSCGLLIERPYTGADASGDAKKLSNRLALELRLRVVLQHPPDAPDRLLDTADARLASWRVGGVQGSAEPHLEKVEGGARVRVQDEFDLMKGVNPIVRRHLSSG